MKCDRDEAHTYVEWKMDGFGGSERGLRNCCEELTR